MKKLDVSIQVQGIEDKELKVLTKIKKAEAKLIKLELKLRGLREKKAKLNKGESNERV